MESPHPCKHSTHRLCGEAVGVDLRLLLWAQEAPVVGGLHYEAGHAPHRGRAVRGAVENVGNVGRELHGRGRGGVEQSGAGDGVHGTVLRTWGERTTRKLTVCPMRGSKRAQNAAGAPRRAPTFIR